MCDVFLLSNVEKFGNLSLIIRTGYKNFKSFLKVLKNFEKFGNLSFIIKTGYQNFSSCGHLYDTVNPVVVTGVKVLGVQELL